MSVLEAGDNDEPGLAALDPGERSAISLGITLKADLILIDEHRGYAAAVSKGLEATGTLGILDLAAKRTPIDLRVAVERLKQTNVRYRKEMIERLLALNGDRYKGPCSGFHVAGDPSIDASRVIHP